MKYIAKTPPPRTVAPTPATQPSRVLLTRPQSRGGRYALAGAATAVALAARIALAPVLPPTGYPFLTFFPAAILTALLAGLGPGLFASALSIAAADFFFIPEIGFFGMPSAADAIALGFFAAVLLVDCVVLHVMTTSLDRVRQSRRELTASERRFRAFSDATREGVVIHDGGVIVDANDAFWRMHGLASRGEVIGLAVMDLIAPEGRDVVADSIRRHSTEPCETIGVRPDGTTFPVEIEARAIEHAGRPMQVAIARDLTRRRAILAAKAESDARLRDLLATLDLGAFMARDLDGTIRFWSRGCERLYGWNAEEAVGHAAHELLRTTFPRPSNEIAAALECEGEWTGDLCQRSRDGRKIVVATRKVLRRAADGRAPSVLEIVEDVTAERRAEAELAASKERLRLAVEGTGLATWDADLTQQTEIWSANRFSIFGYPPDPTGRATRAMWRDRIHPEDWPAIETANRQARQGQAPSMTAYRIRRADTGAERWIESIGRYLEHGVDGEPRRMVGVDLDVTERRKAETSLAASEARLRSIVDTAPDGILVTSPKGRIVSANPAALRMFGYDDGPSALLGQSLDQLMFDEAGAQHGGCLAAYHVTGKAPAIGVSDTTLSGRRRDGSEFPIDLSVGVFEVGGERFFTSVVRDVSHRVAAEAALRESEARFRALAEAIPSLLFVTDAAGSNLYLNPRFAEYTGIPLDSLMGDGWLRIIHPDDRARAAETWDAAVRSGGRYETECRFRRHDGTWRWFLSRGLPVRDSEKRVLRWVGTCSDIDDRKVAEEALRESEVRLKIEAERVDLALRAGAIIGTWDWDLPTDRFTVDERFAESFGIDPTLGRTRLSLKQVIATVHPDDLAGLRAAISEAISRGGPYSHEYRVRGRAGVYRWIEANGRVDHGPDGTPLRFPGVLLDIERRRAAEAALRENETRLRLALEAGGMGFWSWDLGTDRLEWDARQFELFGLDPARGQPSGEDALSTVHPDDLPGLSAAIQAAIAVGDGAFSHEFRVVHAKDVRWLAGHGHAVAGSDGRAIRMVGLNFDVSARREAEAVLAREAEQLDRLAEERGRALAESERRLAQAARMEALGRLAGGIAHDFNNVLQAVQGGIALASRRLPTGAEPVRKYLGLAAEAAGRGAAVTGRLLSFARRGELRSEPVAAGPLLQGLADFLKPVLGPNVSLRTEAHPGLPPLLADKGQLEAVLVNLINNARDAMPGGGALILKADAVSVPGAGQSPHGTQPGSYLCLSVTDEGEGMLPEVLARVSEPFFTTKPDGKGTGLGLAMARGFAEQSGGGLSIESAPGQGTTVSVWLPRAPEEAMTPDHPHDDAVSDMALVPCGGIAILLVEDKAEVRTVMAAQLQDHGYTVRAGEDAAAALALLEGGFRPHALVTDFSMPGLLDGLDLLGQVRLRLPRLPAVLVTGHAGDVAPERMDDAERGGPFSLLRKPAAPEALYDRLARVLRQAGIRDIAASR